MASAKRSAAKPAAEVKFSLAYDGPALKSGRMDAKLFAPALLATAALVERAAEVMYQDGRTVTVQVDAEMRRGSFSFDLTAVAGIAGVVGQQAFHNLNVTQIKAILRSLGLLGKYSKSLFAILAKYGDKPVDRVEQSGDGNMNVIVQGDNNKIVIALPGDVARLFNDAEVRKQAYSAITPVQNEGITEFRVGSKSRPSLVVSKDEAPKFVPPPGRKNLLTDSTGETAVELLMPSFVDGNKWRVSQGGDPFWATITDEVFLHQVDGGEFFAKGDYLIVEMATRVFATSKGLDPVREITRVIRHERRPRQKSLFDDLRA